MKLFYNVRVGMWIEKAVKLIVYNKVKGSMRKMNPLKEIHVLNKRERKAILVFALV